VSSLEALFFDIDDTLCATTAFAQVARRNAVHAMIAAGLRADEAALYRELEDVIAEFSSNYEHHFDKLLLRLDPRALEHLDPALVVAAGVAAYHDTKFRELAPFPGVIELLRDLRAAGLKVGIITHGLTVKQAEKLVRLGLVPHLDPEAIFISDQMGVAKPNPKIYAMALRGVGVAAERAMYDPAHRLGMITCWARLVQRHTLGQETPHHTIEHFGELRAVLRAHYGVSIPG
jgi:putative hydrolase of the HAD superfamily